jgi:hypothetical protein
MVDSVHQEKLHKFLIDAKQSNANPSSTIIRFAYEAAYLIHKADIVFIDEIFHPRSPLHTWFCALLSNEVDLSNEVEDGVLDQNKYTLLVFPDIVSVLSRWFSLTKDSSQTDDVINKPASKPTASTGPKPKKQGPKPQANEPPRPTNERPPPVTSKMPPAQQRSREVRVTGLLTRFNEQILEHTAKLSEEPTAEAIRQCLAMLNFSTHAMAQANIRKIPGKDVIFLAFPNVDIAQKFVTGKAHKLRAFPRDEEAGLPAISMNYHDRFPTDTATRIAQIRRSLAKVNMHASNTANQQPQPQPQPQPNAVAGGNASTPQEGKGEADALAMEVAPTSLTRTAAEAGLTSPLVNRKKGPQSN